MPTQRGLWDVPSIVSTIDFDLESDSFSDFGSCERTLYRNYRTCRAQGLFIRRSARRYAVSPQFEQFRFLFRG
jgi:hypothetical protein